jgi:hypothetical protein
MNPKIKALEQQCWSHRIDGVLVDGHLHFDTAKFAELIVQECVKIVRPGSYFRAYPDDMIGGEDGIRLLEIIANQIEEHFDPIEE